MNEELTSRIARAILAPERLSDDYAGPVEDLNHPEFNVGERMYKRAFSLGARYLMSHPGALTVQDESRWTSGLIDVAVRLQGKPTLWLHCSSGTDGMGRSNTAVSAPIATRVVCSRYPCFT